MLFHIVTLILVLLCEVKSVRIEEGPWMDMKNSPIDNIEEYCNDKNCLIKCCPDGHVIVLKRKINFTCHPIQVKNTEFNKYITSDTSLSEMNTSYFHFVQNGVLSDLNKNELHRRKKFELLPDGSMKYNSTILPRLRFCVDFSVTTKKLPPKLVFSYVLDPTIPDAEAKQLFIIVGMLISSFFMVLVLIVYAVLPNLQNIVGMVLMAYLLSLSVGYTVRATQMIIILNASPLSCFNTSAVFYFFMLASFFWLNIMSLDLWWTLRGARKCREIHRQGERVKFLWYCLYAWGTPALITLIVIIVDRLKLYNNIMYEPPFESCFAEVFSTRIYMHVPIGIMTLINVVLFLMTVYNIWMIKRSVCAKNDSRTTKREKNRFVLYMKLFIIMGVSWVFEQISTEDWVWHIILNSMPLFSGVFIFYVFVCKKSIILMLCKRFDITNRYVERLRSTTYSYTESTKSGTRKSHYSHKPSEESTELTSCTTDL